MKPDRTSREALDQAEFAVWKPRLETLDRLDEVNREADRRRDAIWERFDKVKGSLGGPPRMPDEAPEEIRDGVTQNWNATPAGIQEISRALRQINEWQAREVLSIEKTRDEQDRSELLPFGDVAIAQLRELRAELAALFAGSVWPTPDQYKELFLKVWVPKYNALSTSDRHCIECGTLFALRDHRAKVSTFCSKSCGARDRNRGRARVSKADKMKDQIEKHMASCRMCKQAGRACPRLDALLAGEQALHARSQRLRDEK